MVSVHRRFNKLIRDRIPEIMTSRGVVYRVRQASEDEFALALSAKAVEELAEVCEVLAATEADNCGTRLLEELADLNEVRLALTTTNPFFSSEGLNVFIEHILRVHKLERDKVEAVRLERLDERGGFTRHLILEWTEVERE